ncbi:MAG TPA: family 1 glycosylhydrolase [Gemmatimonadaceae bacterium]
MPLPLTTGIETGYPTLADGHRIDQMDRCGHYAHWEEDFELARELGVHALRYGPAYYRTHLAPDEFDWESCDEQMVRLRQLGIEVIADLCHFGVPSWLGGFQDAAFPVLFAEYARAFARRYSWVRHFTPVFQIHRCATRSALTGEWNERESSDAAFVTAMRNLCMAHELAVEAICAERPDAVIVQCERLERPPANGTAAGEPDRWHALRFLSLDLTLGHELAPGLGGYLQQHGVTSNDLSFFRERRARHQRWVGLDYVPSRERGAACAHHWTTPARPAGWPGIAAEHHARYGVPLVHAGSTPDAARAVAWLHERWREALALGASGIPVPVFHWASLTDTIDWSNGASIAANPIREIGLCTLGRDIRPVGEAFVRLGAGGRGSATWGASGTAG